METISLLHFDGNSRDERMNAWIEHGSPSYTTDGGARFGSCINFNGSNQYLSLPSSPKFNLSGDWTIEGYILPTANKTAIIVRKGYYSYNILITPGGSAPIIQVTLSKNGIDWQFNEYTAIQATLGERMHFAIVRHMDNIYQFKNGKLLKVTPFTGEIFANNEDITIGAIPGYNYFFAGKMDEFRISAGARWTTDFVLPMSPYIADDAADNSVQCMTGGM